MIGAIHVANSIILKSHIENVSITPSKLYCLVYLIYSKYLYIHSAKLFNEPFLITDEDIIVPSLYYKFNCYRNKQIIKFARDAKGNVMYINNEAFNKCLEEIWYKYINFSDLDLLNIINYKKYIITKDNNQRVLSDLDILNVEIEKNEELLNRAKVLKNNLIKKD